MDYKTVKDKVK